MKIVFLITRSDTIGGAQAHVRDLARRSQDEGYEVEVWAGGSGIFADYLDQNGVAVRAIRNLVREVSPVRDLKALLEIVSLLKVSSPDILTCHSGKAGVLGCAAARIVGVPAIFTAHGWTYNAAERGPARLAQSVLERLTSALSSRVITVSNYDYQLALEDNICEPGKMICVPNGVHDIGANQRRRHKLVAIPRIVTVARLQPPKDFVTLIEGLAAVDNLSWHLDVVGDGPDEANVRELVNKHGLSGRVSFLGLRHDVDAILSRSDLFLLVSKKEGFPLSILEAMRAGLPVVASDVGGVAEAVDDGATGYVVPAGDASSLANRLRVLLGDVDRRRSMGAAGRRRYEAEFTFDQMFVRTVSAYAMAVSSSTFPSPD